MCLDRRVPPARAQFGFTVAFHIVFPAFSIGLASYLMVLEALWLRTGKQVYLDLFRYWIKIFSIGFAMGVVSGLVMSYQFGTNWSQYADKAGPVIGPVMAYEVLTAFFLEAGFLGVMLFGMERVGRKLHFFATCMVAGGTLPVRVLDPVGQQLDADPGRLRRRRRRADVPHRLLAGDLQPVGFRAGAAHGAGLLSDRRVYRQRSRGLPPAARPRTPAVRTMFSMAMWMAAIVAPIQIGMGDLHGLNTLEHQPMKIAAMEGDWEPSGADGAPLILFGLPNMGKERTDYKIEIPHASSFILTHSWNGRVPGLKEVPPADRPYAPVVFWTFRVMVGLGFLMFGLGAVQPGRAVAEDALHQPPAAPGRSDHVAGSDRRHAVRLDDHRDRPPALYRLWGPAYRRQRLADRSAGDCDLARDLCRGLFRRVRGRRRRHPAPDVPAAGHRRDRTSAPIKPIRTAGIHPGLPGAVPPGTGARSRCSPRSDGP